MNQEQIQEKESIKIVNLRKTIIIKDENGKVILNLTKTDSISIEGNLNENGVLFSETNPAPTSSTNYNYSYDKNGNVIQDDTGNVVERNNYGPFGSVFEGGNSRYTYTGKETDSTGLSYYGARYYSADVLRGFTQCDSIKPNIYNPQALNCYSYVLNNPYKYTDPNGEEAFYVHGMSAFFGTLFSPDWKRSISNAWYAMDPDKAGYYDAQGLDPYGNPYIESHLDPEITDQKYEEIMEKNRQNY